MKILLVEDEPGLRNSISQFLEKEGNVIETAEDFLRGSEKADIYDYDCVVVDITLPGGNGLDIIRQLKKAKSKAGIVIISAKNSLDDKITGLDIGADDYLPKPFHLPELNARIKSVVRRISFGGENEILHGCIRVFPAKKKVTVHSKEIALTKKEYDLLLFLIGNRDRILTKEAIAEHLWGDSVDTADSFDFIYTHIKNLRKKIVDAGGEDYLRTVYGTGYKFAGEA
ncbi:MAG TPA: response regulator transcription factor [Bacteroidia bacterium]|nr:response regulator transcription factor [Bacteroidia bacterium]